MGILKTTNLFKIFFLLLFLILVFIYPGDVEAAKLYLKLNQDEYGVGDTFLAEIRLDTEGEYINAVEVNLEFPQDLLEVKDFSTGNSILTLWIKEPVFSNRDGTVSFSGGTPGGYQGIKDALGRIAFKVKKTGNARINFGESQVLLNDGFGTPAFLTSQGVVLRLLDFESGETEDEWIDLVEQDHIIPESFKVELSQESSVFEKKYFIIFSTTDKQSGIDYYEVTEQNLIERFLKKETWHKATSPYLLKDQDLESLIKVKAIDKSGNYRVEVLKPEFKISILDVVWILLIILAIGIIFWLIKKRK